jgi:hypothetical protein
LQYIGAPQSYSVDIQGTYPFYNAPIVGTVTLASALPPNMVNRAATPLAWNFSSEQAGLSSANTGAGRATFAFSTDANGNISGWSFSIGTTPNINGPTVVAIQSQNPGRVVTGDGGQYADGTYYDTVSKVCSECDGWSETASIAAGSWYCLAPLVDPLTAEVDSLIAERNELERANAALVTETRTLSAELTAEKAAATDLASEAHTLSVELGADSAAIASLRAEIAKLEAQIAALKK